MLRKARSLILSLVAVLFVVAGCGGGGTNGGPSPTPTATINNQIVLGRLRSVSDAMNIKLAVLPKDEAHQKSTTLEIYNLLKSRPELENVGISAESDAAWATVKGGGKINFLNNRFLPQSGLTRLPRVASTTGKEIPTSSQARILEFFGTEYGPTSPIIKNLLTANGYKLTSTDASIAGLRNVGGDGVFYFDTHGKARPDGMVICSSTHRNAFTELVYVEDWILGRVNAVTLPIDEHGKEGSHEYFGITSEFVKTYMRFGQNSFVFFNACESNNDEVFKKACFDAGASVYVGWTKEVRNGFANQAGLKTIQYLMGSGGNPKAIDYNAVKTQLGAEGADVDKAKFGAELIFTPNSNGGGFAQLAPSIDSATYDKTTKNITINGTFGSDPGPGVDGVVRLGTAVLARPSNVPTPWTSTLLTYSAVGVAPGTYNLFVSVRGHKSNLIPVQVGGWPTQLIIKGLRIKAVVDSVASPPINYSGAYGSTELSVSSSIVLKRSGGSDIQPRYEFTGLLGKTVSGSYNSSYGASVSGNSGTKDEFFGSKTGSRSDGKVEVHADISFNSQSKILYVLIVGKSYDTTSETIEYTDKSMSGQSFVGYKSEGISYADVEYSVKYDRANFAKLALSDIQRDAIDSYDHVVNVPLGVLGDGVLSIRGNKQVGGTIEPVFAE